MPGAQPRKEPIHRLLSSLLRGTAAKAPGAVRVIRVQRSTQQSG